MEGDAAIPRRWSLEFLLRKSKIDSTNLIKKLIRRIPVSNNDSRLKIAILLRTLEEGLSKASIAEWMLEILEVLEEMFRCEGSPITAAMSAAYCGVAVECTLKYLEVEVSHPSYLKAIKRIWRGRFHYMEPSASTSGEGSLLFSHELKRWRNEIEASVSDRSVMYKLAAVNTRRDAIKKLKVYLAEAWENYGPSFLEFAVEALRKSTGNLMYPTQKLGVGAPERKQPRGAAIGAISAEEMDPSTCSKIDSVSSHEVPKNRESIECSSSELQTLAKDPISNSIDIVTSELPIKDMNQPSVENQSKDANIPDQHACHSTDNNKAANLNETTSDQSNVHQHGLMEPNSTARTHDWDDSIDCLQGETSNRASRFNLPSPKRKRFSPLKSYEATKITKRRKMKRWSQLEQETLKTAVSRFGKGNWKLILNSYKDIFEERTEVDLKDKWRNMMRYEDKWHWITSLNQWFSDDH